MNVVINELSLKLYCRRKYNRVFFFNEKIESPLPRHICVLNILTKNIAKKVKKKKTLSLSNKYETCSNYMRSEKSYQ